MLKRIIIFGVVLLVYTAFSMAQDGRFDASINGGGAFQNKTTGNGITQSATNGGLFFATFRVKFKEKHSVVFNYGRARDSQIFQSTNDFHVGTHISEYSAAYTYMPYKHNNLETFALAGIGALSFAPQNTYVNLPPVNGEPNNIPVDVFAVKQTVPAFLYGGGVDYKLPWFPRFALRLQYRGFLYKNPDFKVTNTSGAISFYTGTRGYMSEPSLGIVFRF